MEGEKNPKVLFERFRSGKIDNKTLFDSLISSGVKTTKFDKKEYFPNALAYIEDYITKNGFDIINVHGSNIRVYHLIKR